MPRSPTTTDAFNAIAEPRRRAILDALSESDQEHDVSWLVVKLGWPQPQVSKHLGVLRAVGLVSVVRKGPRRMYSINGDQLKPVHDWVQMFSKFWEHKLQRIKDRAEQAARSAQATQVPPAT